MSEKRYIGIVTDNDDPDKEGKVKIFIPFLHWGFAASDYPWARQDRFWTSAIPSINDVVWVYFFDEHFYKPYYGNEVNLKNNHSHNETIGSLTGSYPDIQYIKLPSGVYIGLNAKDPELSIGNGDTEIFISKTGDITIEDINSNKIETAPTGITITDASGSHQITMDILGITLKSGDASTWMPNILPTDPLTGVPHGGVGGGIVLLKGA